MSSLEEPLVRVEHVSKKYCRSLKRSLWYGLRDLGGELAGNRGEGRLRLRKDEFLAIDDISFELRRGECLGLIGANGAGKSTLLKMLNGLVRPDAGRIEIRGRVGALIELGAGFNPILTGRENVYINGAVLGLSKKEIDARFDRIVAFAGLAEFIDTPVQSYSSGMRVRLGFAVAAHLEPDVLLIDEVLAVGDASFQNKCIATILEIAQRAAVIFVSHQLSLVARVSSRVALLAGGSLTCLDTNIPAVLAAYVARLGPLEPETIGSDLVRLDAMQLRSNGSVLEGVELSVAFGAELEIELEFSALADIGTCFVKIIFSDSEARGVAECDSRRDCDLPLSTGGRAILQARIPRVELNDGTYSVSVHFIELREGLAPGRLLLAERHRFRLIVRDRIHNFVPYQPVAEWTLTAHPD